MLQKHLRLKIKRFPCIYMKDSLTFKEELLVWKRKWKVQESSRHLT